MESTFLGKDGFIWWKGVIEDRKDPLFLGRAKVRIFGWHTEDILEMPTQDLPWAVPSLPIDNGRNTVGLKEGDWCWGFFMDGPDAQKPVIVGVIPGIDSNKANPQKGYGDQTPDSELVPGSVPRPPEMVPPPTGTAANGDAVTGGKYKNKSQLPGNTIGFGVLASKYDPKNYKYDLNKDGKYDQADAKQMIDAKKSGFFDGTANTASASAPISRYPLETRLNEPMTSRLARNEKVESSVLAEKLANLASGESAGFEGLAMGGGDTIAPGGFMEPPSPYAAKYPYNHVYESESGHVIEVDDTPNAERLHWYHRSGTFREIHPDGTQVNKVKMSEYNFILDSYFHYTENGAHIHANKEYKLKAGASITLNSSEATNLEVGSDLNALAKANVQCRSGKDLRVAIGGSGFIYAEGGKIHIQAANEIILTGGGPVQLVSATSVDLIAPTINLAGDVKGPIPTPPAKASAIENEAAKQVEKIASEASVKEGFGLPNGTPGDVWKPTSDSNGKLVTLSATAGAHVLKEALPTGELEAVKIRYQQPDMSFTEWEVVRPKLVPGETVATGSYKGLFEDGVRHMYRWDKPGGDYPKQLFWVVEGGQQNLILDSGTRHQCFPPASPYNEKINMNLNVAAPGATTPSTGTSAPSAPSVTPTPTSGTGGDGTTNPNGSDNGGL